MAGVGLLEMLPPVCTFSLSRWGLFSTFFY